MNGVNVPMKLLVKDFNIMAQFDEIPGHLMTTQNLLDDERTKMEIMDAADDNLMFFFCNKLIDTKILIVYNPD